MKHTLLSSLAFASALLTSQPVAHAQDSTKAKVTQIVSTKTDYDFNVRKIEGLKAMISEINRLIKEAESELTKIEQAKSEEIMIQLKKQDIDFHKAWLERCEKEVSVRNELRVLQISQIPPIKRPDFPAIGLTYKDQKRVKELYATLKELERTPKPLDPKKTQGK